MRWRCSFSDFLEAPDVDGERMKRERGVRQE
jgi:hypothetical protein